MLKTALLENFGRQHSKRDHTETTLLFRPGLKISQMIWDLNFWERDSIYYSFFIIVYPLDANWHITHQNYSSISVSLWQAIWLAPSKGLSLNFCFLLTVCHHRWSQWISICHSTDEKWITIPWCIDIIQDLKLCGSCYICLISIVIICFHRGPRLRENITMWNQVIK